MAAEGLQADQQWAQARAEVQRLWAMTQQLQGEAQTKTTYTGFWEVAKMAQDTLEAADAASRRARQERMASVVIRRLRRGILKSDIRTLALRWSSDAFSSWPGMVMRQNASWCPAATALAVQTTGNCAA
jgi:hypothetical protein